MPVAKNIKYCRKKAGMTQQTFADEIGVAKSTVVSWETKKTAVPVPSVKKVAEYFGVDFKQFCDIDLEKLEQALSGKPLQLTEQETQHLIMFRKLNPEIKEMLRFMIETVYDRMEKDGLI